MKLKNRLYTSSEHSPRLKDLPGPKGLPVIGYSFSVDASKLHRTFYNLAKQYGAIFGISIFGQDVLVINDIDLARKAFSGDETYGNAFNDRPEHFAGKYISFNCSSVSFRNCDDKGLFILRKILHKALKVFGEGHDSFESHMDEELDRLVSEINKYKGTDCNINSLLKESFGNLMSSLMTGQDAEEGDIKVLWNFMESGNSLLTPGLNFILEMCPFLRHLPGKPGHTFRTALRARNKLLCRFFYLDDKSRLESLKEGDGLVAAFIKLLEKENEKAGYKVIDDLRGFIVEAFFASTDTTTTALMNAFALLLRYPDYARKLQGEIDLVVGKSRKPNLNDRDNMPFTKAFILEVNRYTSEVPLALPHKVLHDVRFEGYHVQKNTLVFLNSWFIHHDDSLWTDPWQFQPERFLDARGQLLPAHHKLRQALVPFGLGRRVCPGETFAMTRIFIYITRLLQEFDFRPPSSGTLPQTDPRCFRPVQVLCVDDYLCKIVPRVTPE